MVIEIAAKIAETYLALTRTWAWALRGVVVAWVRIIFVATVSSQHDGCKQ